MYPNLESFGKATGFWKQPWYSVSLPRPLTLVLSLQITKQWNPAIDLRDVTLAVPPPTPNPECPAPGKHRERLL